MANKTEYNARCLDAVGDPANFPLRTHSGLIFSRGFVRVVHGGRGDYIEFSHDQIVEANIHVPAAERRRFNGWHGWYYYEWRTNDDCHVKIYHQRRRVTYADYREGFFYVSPADVLIEQPRPAGAYANTQRYTAPF